MGFDRKIGERMEEIGFAKGNLVKARYFWYFYGIRCNHCIERNKLVMCENHIDGHMNDTARDDHVESTKVHHL